MTTNFLGSKNEFVVTIDGIKPLDSKNHFGIPGSFVVRNIHFAERLRVADSLSDNTMREEFQHAALELYSPDASSANKLSATELSQLQEELVKLCKKSETKKVCMFQLVQVARDGVAADVATWEPEFTQECVGTFAMLGSSKLAFGLKAKEYTCGDGVKCANKYKLSAVGEAE
ncbi:hypothetical protein [Candidatus Sneabacter namystus]|uniref:Uncharacterized protein n=1 Tax=Candidatus Sneabacter namystus TaxID=2601646 RepID=A0A5C0UK17_9RICK|nr:hypothetical protein [Candidatus Sneabacter namystus]QEK39893.1 hypothetical protein FZC37_03020 [Candidatus Sneabacter namystus]